MQEVNHKEAIEPNIKERSVTALETYAQSVVKARRQIIEHEDA